MKFFSVLGGKRERSTASRTRGNGRDAVQPEVRNIISNKRVTSSSLGGRSSSRGRDRSSSSSTGSWTHPEIDVTAAEQIRNQRFPLSTTSDPWSQATWPDESDGFLVQERGQQVNESEWAVPTDLADPWQGRPTDSWDGVGTREHPIAVEKKDPLATREMDIISRQQQQQQQTNERHVQEGRVEKSLGGTTAPQSMMIKPSERRLYSSDTVPSEDDDAFPEISNYFSLKPPTLTEGSGLTNPSFFQGGKTTAVAPRAVDPFEASVFAADQFNKNSETMEIFADPFAGHFPGHTIVNERDEADDPALDCVDISSDDEDTENRQETTTKNLIQQKKLSRVEPQPESSRVRSAPPCNVPTTSSSSSSLPRQTTDASPAKSQRPTPRSSPVPGSPAIKSRATPASPVVPKPPEPRLERFRGKDQGKIMAARHGMFNQRNGSVPSETSEPILKALPRRSEYEINSVTAQRNTPEKLSSVGTDIRRLKSILRRNNRMSTENVVNVHPAAMAFDENNPMQRAGLRLLSAAVIPIQCMARKHLALRDALTRMWAIVMIQACARRWFIKSNMGAKTKAVIKIQSLYRAGMQRDQLLLQQCCAIEIQRHVRGLLATLDVYEMIYNITIIQTAVRKHLAMNRAMDRMVSIIQIQSVVRTFLVSSELAEQRAAATKIQSLYRSFSGRLNFQLNLLDIIIIQSVFRRKIGQKLADSKRYERKCRAAVRIQTSWRTYDCTMNYLHFLTDVLIAQSAVRRWKARKVVLTLRHRNAITLQSVVRMWQCKRTLRQLKAAVMIQKTWRGFVAYADYMFVIADVVIVQSVVRRRLAIKRRQVMYQQRRQDATVTIQRYWRRFVFETELLILQYEHRAATLIQTQWRRFWHFSNFIISLDGAITIQSAVRSYQAQQRYRVIQSGTIAFQQAVRNFQQRQSERVGRTANAIAIFSVANESQAACMIQTKWRSFTIRQMYVNYRSCRLIQAQIRGHVIRTAYKKGRDAFLNYLAARKIQTYWRRHAAKVHFVRQHVAASKIQSVYRGNEERVNIASESISKAVSSLAVTQTANTVVIQKTWRAFSVSRAYTTFIKVRKVQAIWRGYVVRTAYSEYLAATKIQAITRGYLMRFCFWKRCAARIIQRYARAYLCATPFHKYASARAIQRSWRGYVVRSCYRQQILDSFRATFACIKIQRQTRRFCTQMRYLEMIGSIIVVQTVARRYIANKECEKRRVIKLICNQALHMIDGKNNNFEILVRHQERENAACKIQRFFLWVKAEVDREIRHQEKRLERKNKRRLKRSKKDEEEDAFIENVFKNVTCSPQNNVPIRVAVELATHGSCLSKRTEDVGLTDPRKIAIPEEYRGIAVCGFGQLSKQTGEMNKHSRRDDTGTVTSYGSSTYYKVPVPRLQKLNRSELDEDFCLEEAWIDTEIKNARERSQADRRLHKTSKPSRRR